MYVVDHFGRIDPALCLAALGLLPSRPAEAPILGGEERVWLTSRLDVGRRAGEAGQSQAHGLVAVFKIVWGLRADRSGERIWSTALPLGLTSVSFALTLPTGSLRVTLVLLSLVLLGNDAIKGPFFALATETFSSAQAAGIAAINTLAQLGTGAITSLIGVLREQTGSFLVALLPLCLLTGAGCGLVFWVGRRRARSGGAGSATSVARA
ncbi:hypothetical protein [Methylobacterium sp. Gmos1]